MTDQVVDIPRLPQFDLTRLIDRRPGPNATPQELAQYNADTTEYLRRLNVCLVEWFEEWGRTTNSIISTGTLRVEDEGTTVVATANAMNFVGAGVTVTDAGSNEATVTIPGASATITTKDESVTLSSTVNTLDFVGAGVTASGAGATTTVTIPGGIAGIRVEDEGVSTVAAATGINFTGAGVTVTDAGSNEAKVDIPVGVPGSVVQSTFHRPRLRMARPTGLGGTASTMLMCGSTANGTAAGVTNGTTLFTQQSRYQVTSGTLTTSMIHYTMGQAPTATVGDPLVYRGNAAGCGGFYTSCTWGFNSGPSDTKIRCGLSDAGAASLSGVEPSASVDCIFVGADSTDTNLQLMHNDSAGTCTKVDLGASFPARTAATNWYFAEFSCDPNAGTISYRVRDLAGTADTGTQSVSTNLPTNTTYLNLFTQMGQTTAGVAIVAHWGGLVCESDY